MVLNIESEVRIDGIFDGSNVDGHLVVSNVSFDKVNRVNWYVVDVLDSDDTVL